MPQRGQNDHKFTYCIPLLSSVLNSDVYLPLLLTTAGITLELHLQRPEMVGVAYKAQIDCVDSSQPVTN